MLKIKNVLIGAKLSGCSLRTENGQSVGWGTLTEVIDAGYEPAQHPFWYLKKEGSAFKEADTNL